MSSGLLPKSMIDRALFLQSRLPGWLTNATALGTTAPTITSLTTLNTAALAAYEAQQLALGQAKAATQAFYDSIRLMDKSASDVLKQIKLKAATGGGNAVYVLAVLPVPATPSPRPAPGTPNNFTVALEQNGVLTLNWKCANPAGASGTIYQVARKLGGPGAGAVGTAEEWSVVGTTGDKQFIDNTLPGGGGADGLVTYQVTAIRSTIAGAPAVFTVKFGAAPAEAGEASVVSAPRLAA